MGRPGVDPIVVTRPSTRATTVRGTLRDGFDLPSSLCRDCLLLVYVIAELRPGWWRWRRDRARVDFWVLLLAAFAAGLGAGGFALKCKLTLRRSGVEA